MTGLHEQVYQPAEDSRLLATTATERIQSDERVLDVGTGSGYVATTVHEETHATVIGTDVNPYACQQARENGCDVVRTDIASGICTRFDAVLFNPPYLPTNIEEERNDWMERALSGGPDGRAAIDAFLDSVGRILTDDGRIYLLASTLSDLDAIRERAATNGFQTEIVAQVSIPFEMLVVFEITTKH